MSSVGFNSPSQRNRLNNPTTTSDIDLLKQKLQQEATQWDIHGNNIGIEHAKLLQSPYDSHEMIRYVEKCISQQQNQVFAQHLADQLDTIQRCIRAAQNLPQAERGEDKRGLLEFRKATVVAQQKMIAAALPNCAKPSIRCAGPTNRIFDELCLNLNGDSIVDVVAAPHTLYAAMPEIFSASEQLLSKTDSLPLERHPLFQYLSLLKEEGVFCLTMDSGPSIYDLCRILLNKHGLDFDQPLADEPLSLEVFNNIQTFFRCFNIFQSKYEEKTGKRLTIDIMYSFPRLDLQEYCSSLVRSFPELRSMSAEDLVPFIRLISVFQVGNVVMEPMVTAAIKVESKSLPDANGCSFAPIFPSQNRAFFGNVESQADSNEISVGQTDLGRQIQNLNGSEISMPYMKDADGRAQFAALKRSLKHKRLNMVDMGGGRGETNAVPKALLDSGVQLNILNVEPYAPFAQPYKTAHTDIGVRNVQVIQSSGSTFSTHDASSYFESKDPVVVFSSHSFYFYLADLHKATQTLIRGEVSSLALTSHPLWKYCEMIGEDGVFVVTLQSGAGARLFRNALTGNHGLESPTVDALDQTTKLMKSFGNVETFLRYFEIFAEQYKTVTNKTLECKTHLSVANVPLGRFEVIDDQEKGGYRLTNPTGSDGDPSWITPTMFNFYGNWKELESKASQTTNLSEQATARKTQAVFLRILRAFAPALKQMQHPTITLEIRIKK